MGAPQARPTAFFTGRRRGHIKRPEQYSGRGHGGGPWPVARAVVGTCKSSGWNTTNMLPSAAARFETADHGGDPIPRPAWRRRIELEDVRMRPMSPSNEREQATFCGFSPLGTLCPCYEKKNTTAAATNHRPILHRKSESVWTRTGTGSWEFAFRRPDATQPHRAPPLGLLRVR